MIPWIDIYRDRLNSTYYAYFKERYRPFLNYVVREQSSSYTELGCGMANTTRFIHEEQSSYYSNCIDICPEMLKLAIDNTNGLDEIHYVRRSILDDSLPIDPVETVHSHGVLEHFSNKEIKTILNIYRQSRQVHYVPSSKYKSPSRGDERLLSKSYWKKHFKPTKIIEFNDGHDLILIWE
jgi:SAM-dependent methyltransferase